MRTSQQPPGLRVISRHMLEDRERNRQGRLLQVSLSPPPRPLLCNPRGDGQHQSGPEVSRALHRCRKESRRVVPLSSVGEAGVEEGVEAEAEAGDGGEAEGAVEEGRKKRTRWMYR